MNKQVTNLEQKISEVEHDKFSEIQQSIEAIQNNIVDFDLNLSYFDDLIKLRMKNFK